MNLGGNSLDPTSKPLEGRFLQDSGWVVFIFYVQCLAHNRHASELLELGVRQF